jgi:hypothetical protein
MDPVANLREQRALSRRIIELNGRDMTDAERREAEDAGERLAELVIALDEWRQSGGFDPYPVS